MKVWAGCKACFDRHVYLGGWVDEDEVELIDPHEAHQLEAYDVTVTGAHLEPFHAYTLDDFHVPPDMDPRHVRLSARVMDVLTEEGIEYSAWLMAAWMLDREVYELTPQAFRALYAGTWIGRPTRALRKRYSLTRAGDSAYYMWRA